jgi:hypothetical protein
MSCRGQRDDGGCHSLTSLQLVGCNVQSKSFVEHIPLVDSEAHLFVQLKLGKEPVVWTHDAST